MHVLLLTAALSSSPSHDVTLTRPHSVGDHAGAAAAGAIAGVGAATFTTLATAAVVGKSSPPTDLGTSAAFGLAALSVGAGAGAALGAATVDAQPLPAFVGAALGALFGGMAAAAPASMEATSIMRTTPKGLGDAIGLGVAAGLWACAAALCGIGGATVGGALGAAGGSLAADGVTNPLE